MKITKGHLRQIIREEIKDVKNSLLTETFQSDTLRKLSAGRINRDFFSATAGKYGIQWDKVEDHQIERLRTPKKKGISFAVAGKNIEYLQSKTRQSRYSRTMVGLDAFGYRSLKSIQGIDGLMWYHLDLSKSAEYMGALEVGKLRKAARYGASKFTTPEEFSKQQKERYGKAVKAMKNDPKRIKKEVTKATKHLDKMMKEVLLAKSPTMKKHLKRLSKEYGRDVFDNKLFSAASNIAGRSEDLFRVYADYLREANDSRRKWSGPTRNMEWLDSYAATVVDSTRNILKLKAHTFVQ